MWMITTSPLVMAGLDPAVHVVGQRDRFAGMLTRGTAWMPGSSPGRTKFLGRIE
jgi:hypothetical protein